jgi:hypothetical protein
MKHPICDPGIREDREEVLCTVTTNQNLLGQHLEEVVEMLTDLLWVGLRPRAPHRGHESVGQAHLHVINGGGARDDTGFESGPMGRRVQRVWVRWR